METNLNYFTNKYEFDITNKITKVFFYYTTLDGNVALATCWNCMRQFKDSLKRKASQHDFIEFHY